MGCFSSKESADPVAAAPKPTRQQAPKNVATSTPQQSTVPIPRAKPVITEADKAKHKLKHQRDALSRTLRISEGVLERDLTLARQLHAEGKRESALVLLRRRKLVQSRIAVTSAQLTKIDESIGTIEGAENTAAILDAISAGTKALEKLNACVSVERAEKIMEQSRDTIAYTKEVAAVLEGADDVPDLDDDEILAQIEQFDRVQGIDGEDTEVAAAKMEKPKTMSADTALAEAPAVPTQIPTMPKQPENEVADEEEKTDVINKTPVAA